MLAVVAAGGPHTVQFAQKWRRSHNLSATLNTAQAVKEEPERHPTFPSWQLTKGVTQ